MYKMLLYASEYQTMNYFSVMLRPNKDALIDMIEHEYLFHCSNPVINSCFLIFNPRKYHIRFKRDRAI